MVEKDEAQHQEALHPEAAVMPKEPSMDGDEAEDMESFQELYESSMVNIQEGEVIHGRIIQITDDYVMVDIGYKSEGQIRLDEFKDENGEIQAAVGDEVDALLEYREDDDGAIILSKDKAQKIKIWDDISQIYNADGIIEGMVVSKVKGGLAVDIGIQAFLPGSQVDLRPVRNLESLLNQTFQFKILKYNKKRRNVVLSRRALLEKERDYLKAQTLADLEEGKVV
ncbi:MAG TPA: 30S ribosomal protein S1, partial [Syntrophobacteraceae bacterium]|nr:30S ribosomal protein S1 [Syntrophobacteraceae bacterium]